MNSEESDKLDEKRRELLKRKFRAEHDIAGDAFLIGTAGKLEISGGQRDFVLAANLLAQKVPAARFIIVGRDESFFGSFRRELKRLVKIFGLDERFLWLDFVEDREVFFSALDVFVAPAHKAPNDLNQMILEAMKAGNAAIVATNEANAGGLIENDKTGKLVAAKEPIQIAEAVNDLANDDELRQNLIRNAQAAVSGERA